MTEQMPGGDLRADRGTNGSFAKHGLANEPAIAGRSRRSSDS